MRNVFIVPIENQGQANLWIADNVYAGIYNVFTVPYKKLDDGTIYLATSVPVNEAEYNLMKNKFVEITREEFDEGFESIGAE